MAKAKDKPTEQPTEQPTELKIKTKTILSPYLNGRKTQPGEEVELTLEEYEELKGTFVEEVNIPAELPKKEPPKTADKNNGGEDDGKEDGEGNKEKK